MYKKIQFSVLALATAAICAITQPALAGEGGGSSYNGGVENFMTGAAPPPGFYVVEYGNVYSADTLKDGSGNTIPVPGFKVKAVAAATRFVWSTRENMLGGNLVWHAIVPLVDLEVSAAGASQHKSGVGDITFGPAISFHHSPALHSVLALDFVAPTGEYDKNNLANIGRNYWSLQPVFTMSQIDPHGFNWDFKATLNLARTNNATNYRSGNELYVDYSAGFGLGNGWTVGAGGYWMQQLNADTSNGVDVANSRTKAFAIGPSVKYDNGKGWFITAKLQQEMAVEGRTQGNALWIKSTIPF
ncbi:MAG TPA: transporter [Rhodoferax sp.]